MKLKMEILGFDRPYQDSDVEKDVNEVLGFRAAHGWALVSTAHQWYADSLEVWLYFQMNE